MTVLIDPPAWPAHGTVFSHVVSDASLDELHRFAAATGLSARAFDLDHYDVPKHRYDELVAAGATPVDGRELVRRLIRSGLRVPARARPERVSTALHRRWGRLWAQHLPRADAGAVDRLGRELLRRWSQPHRHYHDLTHLTAVLAALDVLEHAGTPFGSDPAVVRLAAWFHDAVYDADPSAPAGTDEEASARLALDLLDEDALRVPTHQAAETARLVRVTAAHRPSSDDAAAAALCDADLAVLAGPAEDYERYRVAVRADFAHVDDDAWARGRAHVLRSLLEAPTLFTTAYGRARWEVPARANLARELEALT